MKESTKYVIAVTAAAGAVVVLGSIVSVPPALFIFYNTGSHLLGVLSGQGIGIGFSYCVGQPLLEELIKGIDQHFSESSEETQQLNQEPSESHQGYNTGVHFQYLAPNPTLGPAVTKTMDKHTRPHF
jgi:hypothetical protein